MGWHVDASTADKTHWSFCSHYTNEEIAVGEYTNGHFKLFDYDSDMVLPFISAALAWKYLNDRKVQQHGF